jgi:hypothetical protein
MIESPLTVLASWFDPGENGFDVSDALSWCLLIAALYGGSAVAAKIVRTWDAWKDRRHRLDVEAILLPHITTVRDDLDSATAAIIQLVKETTRPIQPNTNGGLSMTDLHTKLDVIGERIVVVEEHQAEASAERARILRVGAANAKTVTDAIAALGAEIELLPFTPPDDCH